MLWSIELVLLLRCMLARVHIIHNVKLLLLLLLLSSTYVLRTIPILLPFLLPDRNMPSSHVYALCAARYPVSHYTCTQGAGAVLVVEVYTVSTSIVLVLVGDNWYM